MQAITRLLMQPLVMQPLVMQPLARLLPNHCYLCGDESREFLCTGCQRDLPTVDHSCYCCALPLVHNPGHLALCGDCLRQPKPFTRTLAAFTYGHPIDFLINRFKHHRHFVCGDYLSEHLLPLLHQAYKEDTWPEALVPVPLHWTRYWVRGFNQSQLIAYRLHQHLNTPVMHGCRRIRRNPRQQGLKRKERLRNLRQTFITAGNLAGRHIALVDDVMTTGATVTELAQRLRQAGAARVDVWVLARVA